jgi:hypothetical protein
MMRNIWLFDTHDMLLLKFNMTSLAINDNSAHCRWHCASCEGFKLVCGIISMSHTMTYSLMFVTRMKSDVIEEAQRKFA